MQADEHNKGNCVLRENILEPRKKSDQNPLIFAFESDDLHTRLTTYESRSEASASLFVLLISV